jgi:hypothetical protein
MPKYVFNAQTQEMTEEEIQPGDAVVPYVPTPEEEAWTALLLEAKNLTDVPEWALYTRQEAVTAIHNGIGSGKTAATMKAEIDALPGTVAGMKTAIKALIDDVVVPQRAIIEKMAIMIVHLRNRTYQG